jgi:hypothetical protein
LPVIAAPEQAFVAGILHSDAITSIVNPITTDSDPNLEPNHRKTEPNAKTGPPTQSKLPRKGQAGRN